MNKFILAAGLAAALCLTACGDKPEETPNGPAKMTVADNQIRYGDKIVNVEKDIHYNVDDNSNKSYYVSAWNDAEKIFCAMDFFGTSLGKDIDIAKRTDTDYMLRFDYSIDDETSICSFSVGCNSSAPAEEAYNTFPETGAVKMGILRIEPKDEILTVTLNAISVDGVVVQAKIVGKAEAW